MVAGGSCEHYFSILVFKYFAFGLSDGIFYDLGWKDTCPARRGMEKSRHMRESLCGVYTRHEVWAFTGDHSFPFRHEHISVLLATP